MATHDVWDCNILSLLQKQLFLLMDALGAFPTLVHSSIFHALPLVTKVVYHHAAFIQHVVINVHEIMA